MNTEHTPGPWKAAGPLCTHIIDSRRILIAYAPHFRDMTRKEGFANRDLIAAAPDLLAALKALLRECKYQAEIGNIPDNRVEFAVADAAIAKAEGKA